MIEKYNKVLDRFGIKSKRTLNIVNHVAVSFFYKAGAVFANFLLVPLTIDYLDTENYGVWLTLSSFIGWFTFLDIGLGNGLRNKFAEAKTKRDFLLARAYISSAYFTISCISILLFIVFMGLNFFIDWTTVFNANKDLAVQLNMLMPIVFGCFSIQLVVKLIGNIYLADLNHSIQVKIHFFTQVLLLVFVWFLIKTSGSSLLIFGIVFSVLPLIVLFGFNLIGFTGKYKDLKPTIALWEKKHLKDIMGIGFDFFIIQISGIMLLSTDNFIISKIFSPEEVVPYNIAFKYFSILTMIFTIIVTPYWSSFTEAYVKKDYEWIRRAIKNILKIWVMVPFLLIIMLILSSWFYEMWVGDKITIPFELSLSMALFVSLFTFRTIFNFFINGVGKIKIQMILGLASMVMNIPLSIIFAKYLNLGSSGVILATCISIGISVIFSPIQYYKIINLKAKGIWNL